MNIPLKFELLCEYGIKFSELKFSISAYHVSISSYIRHKIFLYFILITQHSNYIIRILINYHFQFYCRLELFILIKEDSVLQDGGR